VNNDDYPYCWVFEDKRFNLQDGSDEVYLKFLCEVFPFANLESKLGILSKSYNLLRKSISSRRP